MAAGGRGEARGHEGKAILAAFCANLGIAIAKFVGFIFTQSGSLLAEAAHSFADTGNQALLLLGGKRSRRKPTEEFPFGFGRERYFWSFVVALVLFSLGSLFAIYEGFHKLEHPEPLENPTIAYVILGVAAILEGLSLRTAVRESIEAKDDLTWFEFLRKAKIPELPVVLLEDIGAELGLLIALTAITTGEITGNFRWDGYGTLAIGGLLGVIAVFLAIEMKGLLIGEAADPSVVTKIRDAIEDDEQVERIIHLRTQHLGPEELLIAAKVEFTDGLSVPELATTIDRVESSIRHRIHVHSLIYIEPDVHDPDR
jgi:cation diffusion facilitator family transporter